MNHLAPFSFGNIQEHQEAVSHLHRFQPRTVAGKQWTFEHLEAFVMKMTISLPPQTNVTLDIVVLFSNHCFTRKPHPEEILANDQTFQDNRETRVLDQKRYDLSKKHLLGIVKDLPSRKILIADARRPNYVTLEISSEETQTSQQYAVFF